DTQHVLGQLETVITIGKNYQTDLSRTVDQGKALEAGIGAPMEGREATRWIALQGPAETPKQPEILTNRDLRRDRLQPTRFSCCTDSCRIDQESRVVVSTRVERTRCTRVFPFHALDGATLPIMPLGDAAGRRGEEAHRLQA